jgi:hypothetical protein
VLEPAGTYPRAGPQVFPRGGHSEGSPSQGGAGTPLLMSPTRRPRTHFRRGRKVSLVGPLGGMKLMSTHRTAAHVSRAKASRTAGVKLPRAASRR